ncbi:hypothetical protein M758_3G262600 [Ceratodon purpureus]|uniref:AP2/ERF domain-containing protein n=1 Tax=Ceratodon purpureus TaxID=3225 RepID=A0A8T0IQ55_CERPU|nr:hypothetical protein KC19_3G262000 [Ceratodon purpureus]KAG0624634.1 hypothetical protein M758_3G262600 [Ceratodon purpureus]
MVGSWKKCRRTSSEHASPRGGRRSRIREFFEPESPTSSPSPSPPRRRDALKKLVVKIVHPRGGIVADDSEYMQNPETKNYRGVRYRVELNKYVTEIRPSRSTKKIWLGTYDTAEEAARAFDIGNLCCKKNLPLNFPDSPRMLRKISSRLSPDEARNAIAKLAKEVARVVSINVSSDAETAKRKEVDRAAAEKAIELLQQKAEDPGHAKAEAKQKAVLLESELQTQHLETGSTSSGITYTELLEENIATVDFEEMATPMPLQAGGEAGSGGHSWSFNLSRMFIPDDNATVPLHKLINFGSESKYGDVLVHTYP